MTNKEKRQMLATLIFNMVQCGYDISNIMGRPLSYFDFEKVTTLVEKYTLEYENQK